MLGTEEYARFELAMDSPAPVSVRVHPQKFKWTSALERVPWSRFGYYLEERPVFSSDPLWHAGAYYVQEASSMLIEAAFNSAVKQLEGPLRLLDLCAAPGGKSTHLASLLQRDDVLVCNEIIRSRVPVLAENLRKHGADNCIITNADSSDFEQAGALFDLILVDAPCSGEGLFRRDHAAMDEWSPDNIQTCELRQRRILESAAASLKTGGFMIYSTCTWNPGENELQLEFIRQLGFEPATFNVLGQEHTEFRAYPHKLKGEGFFMALLRKTAAVKNSAGQKHPKLKPVRAEKEWTELLKDGSCTYGFEDTVFAGPENCLRFAAESLGGIRIHSIASELGRQNGRLFSPSEYLPFSLALKPCALPSEALEQSEALRYFARNPLPYSGSQKGYLCLSFMEISCGLGKYAGNRINNLFPNEWKLRNMPEKERFFCLADSIN